MWTGKGMGREVVAAFRKEGGRGGACLFRCVVTGRKEVGNFLEKRQKTDHEKPHKNHRSIPIKRTSQLLDANNILRTFNFNCLSSDCQTLYYNRDVAFILFFIPRLAPPCSGWVQKVRMCSFKAGPRVMRHPLQGGQPRPGSTLTISMSL